MPTNINNTNNTNDTIKKILIGISIILVISIITISLFPEYDNSPWVRWAPPIATFVIATFINNTTICTKEPNTSEV